MMVWFCVCPCHWHLCCSLHAVIGMILLISIRFALFTIRPLVARFELTWRPWCIKKGRVAGFHIISSLFNKLKKDVIWRPFLKASRGPLSFASARGTVVESDCKLSKANYSKKKALMVRKFITLCFVVLVL